MGVYDWYYLLYPVPSYTHIRISCYSCWTYVQIRLESENKCYACTFIPRSLDTCNGLAPVQNPPFNFQMRERIIRLTCPKNGYTNLWHDAIPTMTEVSHATIFYNSKHIKHQFIPYIYIVSRRKILA